jgi:6-pyruvoyltetrahydropterin/6-carboxytetrahydropterin synthase
MMYRICKRMEIAGAHRLKLPYESGCSRMHGHNWIIEITCETADLNGEGMVLDFARIKEIVGKLDHNDLGWFVEQPTAENIARWIADQIGPDCVEVMVQESEGNRAWFIR